MSIITTSKERLFQQCRIASQRAYDFGNAHVLLTKSAATPVLAHSLSGRLVVSSSGWGLLEVPNALVRGAFEALNATGAELPPAYGDSKNWRAHISVFRPDELESIGGPQKLVERGKSFGYTLGPVREIAEPQGWREISKVWYIEVKSPELEKLRKSYGLTGRPKDNKFQFHITFAVRKRNVLRENQIKKSAENDEGDRKAVIVKGNPKYVADNPKADDFYQKLREHLEGLGYSVGFDAGEPFTEPAPADLWLGHSRGADRLRFAPEGTKTVAVGSSREGAINHPDDDNAEVPTDSHYLLTPEMLEKISEAAKPVKTVAVDLDGTIAAYDGWKGETVFGKVRPNVRKVLQTFRDKNYRIIIFTVRGNTDDVKEYLEKNEVPFDYINENPDQPPRSSGKVFADVYIDDRGVNASQSWKKIEKETEKLLKAASLLKSADDEDERPYRDRAEMYPTKGPLVLGGLFTGDGTFGGAGGGVDPGETPEQAAARETLEELGYEIQNPRLLDVPPLLNEWKPPYNTEKQKERAKQFRGSRTFFATGDLTDKPRAKTKPEDQSHLKNVRLRRIPTALKHLQERGDLQDSSAERAQARRAALEAILRLQKGAQVQEPWEIKESPIEGKGLFANRAFKKGEVIVPDMMTRHEGVLGLTRYNQNDEARFTNHEACPAAVLVKNGNLISTVAARDIQPGDELTANYMQADSLLGPDYYYTYRHELYDGHSSTGRGWEQEKQGYVDGFEKVGFLQDTSGMLPTIRALAVDPVVHSWAQRHGLVYAPGKGPIPERVDRLREQAGRWQATNQGIEADLPTYRRFLNGLAYMMGAKPGNNPEMQKIISRVSKDFKTIGPYIQSFAPELWERLHGWRGSAANLSQKMYMADRGLRDTTTGRRLNDPTASAEKAKGVFNSIFGPGKNRAGAKGFTATQFGDLYSTMNRKGLLGSSSPLSASQTGERMKDVAAPLAAVRDLMQTEGFGKKSSTTPLTKCPLPSLLKQAVDPVDSGLMTAGYGGALKLLQSGMRNVGLSYIDMARLLWKNPNNLANLRTVAQRAGGATPEDIKLWNRAARHDPKQFRQLLLENPKLREITFGSTTLPQDADVRVSLNPKGNRAWFTGQPGWHSAVGHDKNWYALNFADKGDGSYVGKDNPYAGGLQIRYKGQLTPQQQKQLGKFIEQWSTSPPKYNYGALPAYGAADLIPDLPPKVRKLVEKTLQTGRLQPRLKKMVGQIAPTAPVVGQEAPLLCQGETCGTFVGKGLTAAGKPGDAHAVPNTFVRDVQKGKAEVVGLKVPHRKVTPQMLAEQSRNKWGPLKSRATLATVMASLGTLGLGHAMVDTPVSKPDPLRLPDKAVPDILKKAFSTDNGVNTLEQITQGQFANMDPKQVEMMVRRLQALGKTEEGGASTVFQLGQEGAQLAQQLGLARIFGPRSAEGASSFGRAFAQLGGRQGFGGLTLNEARALDQRLRLLAAESPLANQVAATFNLVEAGLADPNSPATEIVGTVRQGRTVTPSGININQISGPQWVELMKRSGISEGAAWNQYRARKHNQAAIHRNQLGDFVRRQQSEVEVTPMIQNTLGQGMMGTLAAAGIRGRWQQTILPSLSQAMSETLRSVPPEMLTGNRQQLLATMAQRLSEVQPQLAARLGPKGLREMAHSAMTFLDDTVRSEAMFQPYRNLTGLLAAHRSDIMDAARAARSDAQFEAQLASQTAHLGQQDWLSRTSDVVSEAGPQTTWPKTLARAFGAVPRSQMQGSSPPKLMASVPNAPAPAPQTVVGRQKRLDDLGITPPKGP